MGATQFHQTPEWENLLRHDPKLRAHEPLALVRVPPHLIPRFLYHGTSQKHEADIRANGISSRKVTNWTPERMEYGEDVPQFVRRTNPYGVYLGHSNSFAYAILEFIRGYDLIIFEVDSRRLNPNNFYFVPHPNDLTEIMYLGIVTPESISNTARISAESFFSLMEGPYKWGNYPTCEEFTYYLGWWITSENFKLIIAELMKVYFR